MMEKGYVVCLLKHMLGDKSIADALSGDTKTVCLGYFGRVDIVPVNSFQDYMQIASENNAEFLGTRKQMMLYSLGEDYSKGIVMKHTEDEKELPFQPSDDSLSASFCCLSIININPKIKEEPGNNAIRHVATDILNELQQYIKQANVTPMCSVMGLLGMEDLCVISLADDYKVISGAINHIRNLNFKGSSTDIKIVNNSHSILMIDGKSGTKYKCENVYAEIHFSLKTSDGLGYLKEIKEKIQSINPNAPVEINIRTGEYDAFIWCYAQDLLNSGLYGQGGLLSYAEVKYQTSVYQSETILYERIEEEKTNVSCEPTGSEDNNDYEGMKIWIDKKIESITKSILGTEEDKNEDISYIKMGIYRLWKDYMHIASIPHEGLFEKDIEIQFRAALEAIVLHAKKIGVASTSLKLREKGEFDRCFSKIIDALSSSMQAANQIDRFYFEEQHSHLDNTGAYHKILLAYYGIVKEILQLLYAIPRNSDSQQEVIIPLISFGHTTIVYSNEYPSLYEDKPAKLVCITMPYQALKNLPKYIGMLVHEIFHYSVPSNRSKWNEEVGLWLTAAAFMKFLDEVGQDSSFGSSVMNLGKTVLMKYENDFLLSARKMSDRILCSQNKRNNQNIHKGIELFDAGLSSSNFFIAMRSCLTPNCNSQFPEKIKKLYCDGWIELRSHLLSKQGISREVSRHFLLDGVQEEATVRSTIEELYEKVFVKLEKSIRSCIAVYIKVLDEVPPDLFDIDFVLNGEDRETKARQYLWQIHSIRSDKLNYLGDKPSRYDGNNVRTCSILDYFVFEDPDQESKTEQLNVDRKKEMDQRLRNWFEKDDNLSDHQKQEQRRLLEYTLNEYDLYLTDSLFVRRMLNEYIPPINEQINALNKDEQSQDKIQKLSSFYKKYYEALANNGQDTCASILFDLSINMMESFQKQLPLSTICEHCGKAIRISTDSTEQPNETQNSPTQPYWNCDFHAIHPKDLSSKIIEVCHELSPNGNPVQLWFRGESKVGRDVLPGIMRNDIEPSSKGFLPMIRTEVTLAKSKILPYGQEFNQAEWLALLQHYEFRTNLLDWTEDLMSALYFATEDWQDPQNGEPKTDAVIHVLNPILLNLAVDLLEANDKSKEAKDLDEEKKKEKAEAEAYERLKTYLTNGELTNSFYPIPLFSTGEEAFSEHGRDVYSRYFDYSGRATGCEEKRPRAAMTSSNNDRIRAQRGNFVFFDLYEEPTPKGDETYIYEKHELFKIQKEYLDYMMDKYSKEHTTEPLLCPFLCKIALNCRQYKEFVQYVQAIGLRKFNVYPEINNLVGDIQKIAFGSKKV